MKTKILELLKKKEAETSQGIQLSDLANLLSITLQETKNLLNELYKEKKIKIRQGVNQKLIYLK